MDEMLAKFVVDSHFKSQPKGANIAGKSLGNSQEESEEASTTPVDPEVLYLTPFFSFITCLVLPLSDSTSFLKKHTHMHTLYLLV